MALVEIRRAAHGCPARQARTDDAIRDEWGALGLVLWSTRTLLEESRAAQRLDEDRLTGSLRSPSTYFNQAFFESKSGTANFRRAGFPTFERFYAFTAVVI